MPERNGAAEPVHVDVDGHRLRLTNLEKVLYPGSGTTKAEVLSYVAAVAPAFLAQLADRPVTRLRWPHGTGGASFFEKNVPAGTPDWVRTVTLDSPGSTRSREQVTYPLVDSLAGLTWLANLSALELHVPQWRVDEHGAQHTPDRLVVDLDPGPGAGLRECARVALIVAQTLDDVLPGARVPVTSGSKGLQVYSAVPAGFGADDPDATRQLAHGLATALEGAHPDLIVSKMTKSLRGGRVLLDWSQNTRAKTTICPYSLRGKGPTPTVAAPRTWDEIDAAATGEADLVHLGPAAVVERLGTHGDLMAALRD